MWENKKIVVLLGGSSRERDISLKTGRAILESLQRQGYKAIGLDPQEQGLGKLIEEKPDAVIIALHGRFGEDGCMQGILETLRIPYGGCGVLASAICMDKNLTKTLVAAFGITVPASQSITSLAVLGTSTVPLPVVVKPNQEGSTIGMSIVREPKELQAAVAEALRYDSIVLIERFIAGTEVTVGIINGKALPVLEIVPRSGFYDYEAKYTKGATEYIVPARLPESVMIQLQRSSETIYQKLGLSGIVRLDYIVSPEKIPYFLEVNTIPGMTETSLIPKAAEKAGLSFDQVVTAMLQSVGLKR